MGVGWQLKVVLILRRLQSNLEGVVVVTTRFFLIFESIRGLIF